MSLPLLDDDALRMSRHSSAMAAGRAASQRDEPADHRRRVCVQRPRQRHSRRSGRRSAAGLADHARTAGRPTDSGVWPTCGASESSASWRVHQLTQIRFSGCRVAVLRLPGRCSRRECCCDRGLRQDLSAPFVSFAGADQLVISNKINAKKGAVAALGCFSRAGCFRAIHGCYFASPALLQIGLGDVPAIVTATSGARRSAPSLLAGNSRQSPP